MDSKQNSKKKHTSTPANQSMLAFTASLSVAPNSQPIKSPYGEGDRVVTVFQIAFGLLELASLGTISVHKGPLSLAQHVDHLQTFT